MCLDRLRRRSQSLYRDCLRAQESWTWGAVTAAMLSRSPEPASRYMRSTSRRRESIGSRVVPRNGEYPSLPGFWISLTIPPTKYTIWSSRMAYSTCSNQSIVLDWLPISKPPPDEGVERACRVHGQAASATGFEALRPLCVPRRGVARIVCSLGDRTIPLLHP